MAARTTQRRIGESFDWDPRPTPSGGWRNGPDGTGAIGAGGVAASVLSIGEFSPGKDHERQRQGQDEREDVAPRRGAENVLPAQDLLPRHVRREVLLQGLPEPPEPGNPEPLRQRAEEAEKEADEDVGENVRVARQERRGE